MYVDVLHPFPDKPKLYSPEFWTASGATSSGAARGGSFGHVSLDRHHQSAAYSAKATGLVNPESELNCSSTAATNNGWTTQELHSPSAPAASAMESATASGRSPEPFKRRTATLLDACLSFLNSSDVPVSETEKAKVLELQQKLKVDEWNTPQASSAEYSLLTELHDRFLAAQKTHKDEE